ncbi:16S rRNA (cytosine1402-N4)-methyltransferase [Austwickia chelonae]|uniref:Ribosomal RNA small subunit methyltransferase H n=1 Tax=Austwickia chelonae NBRC 105200 TaxID=1184607 RepID=K6UKL8_9MICO|nr:16S rRNA (cytosine(1402)-N(4))-methyltransferase RsmH [Austwickia chelonae]GAB76486.1 ribosomal RNA small subunit methyltransferase H [Austwickia chelonae NBRC 105200]SEW25557.1 16S rRNA (cytosine1402-N4)-methyltransferase [Austwickia chelonae]
MSLSASERHVPVMCARITELLAPALNAPGSVYVDGTLGMGGHTEAVLSACPGARAIGIDRDEQALEQARERLAPFGERFVGVHARYDQIDEVLSDLTVGPVQAILLDLGVSSLQLDEAGRGFAYRMDAPLDMRMDRGLPRTAADVLNSYAVDELTRILRDYGEERFASRIARAVVTEREHEPFESSGRLVELLYRVIPAGSRKTGGHPAKRTFQALRIEVNEELESLSRVLPRAVESCAVDGRFAVLSYHSLEDRMVKKTFAAGLADTSPPDMPVQLPQHAPFLAPLTRGAETADDDEVARNPRSASAKLRVVRRIAPTPPGRLSDDSYADLSPRSRHQNRRKGQPR